MKRKSFLKSLLTILVVPKILGGINFGNEYKQERQRRWKEIRDWAYNASPEELARFKTKSLIDKEPPIGYAIGLDKLKTEVFAGMCRVYKKSEVPPQFTQLFKAINS